MKKILTILFLGLVMGMLTVPNAIGVERDSVAISPFAQIQPGETTNGFYTFLAFTHPSLSTATSQIQFTVSIQGPADNELVPSGDRSETITVNAGETHKVFIVTTNHSIINPTTFSGSTRDHFITTTSGGAVFGNIRVESSNNNPAVEVVSGKFNNLNQISMWGVVFHEPNKAGFAMEFIGDMHDSTIPPNGNGAGAVSLQTARGIN